MYPPNNLVLQLVIAQIARRLMVVVIAIFRGQLALASRKSVQTSVPLLEDDGILTIAHHQ
jgi:hypothetical protein